MISDYWITYFYVFIVAVSLIPFFRTQQQEKNAIHFNLVVLLFMFACGMSGLSFFEGNAYLAFVMIMLLETPIAILAYIIRKRWWSIFATLIVVGMAINTALMLIYYLADTGVLKPTLYLDCFEISVPIIMILTCAQLYALIRATDGNRRKRVLLSFDVFGHINSLVRRYTARKSKQTQDGNT